MLHLAPASLFSIRHGGRPTVAIRRDKGLANEVESLWTIDHCVGYQTRVEGRQLASAFECQCEQVTIRDLRRLEKTTAVHTACIQQGNIVRPEFVTGLGSQRCEQLGNRCRSAC